MFDYPRGVPIDGQKKILKKRTFPIHDELFVCELFAMTFTISHNMGIHGLEGFFCERWISVESVLATFSHERFGSDMIKPRKYLMLS
jgi:hypothetical protein